MIKEITKRIVFPIIFFGSVIAIHFSGNNQEFAYAMMVFGMLLAYFLEKYIPYNKEWLTSHGDFKIDVIHFFVNAILGSAVSVVIISLAAALSPFLTIFYSFSEWISELPYILQVIIGIIIAGFFPYWYHRLSHEYNGFFWNIHSIHHSSERLYWLNATRFHPINAALNVFFGSLPLLILGFNTDVIFIIGISNNYIGFLNHTNIDFKLGFMNWIFNMSEIHRWHHSKNMQEANANYSGGTLVFWDVLLGTRILPKKKLKYNRVGLFAKSKSPKHSYLKQVLFPFIKQQT